MAKTEIAKPTDTNFFRPRDIFSAMRSEMDHMFERFEHGFPRFPHLFRVDSGNVMVTELDVREDATAITVEAELPGVEEKDISVTLSNTPSASKVRRGRTRRRRPRITISPNAAMGVRALAAASRQRR